MSLASIRAQESFAMKKWIIWIGVIGLLGFLATRTFSRHVNGVKEEKKWYLQQLDFEFSGRVENPEAPVRVLFRVTDGKLDINREKAVKAQLKYNGILELLLYRNDGKCDLLIRGPHKYIDGDSLHLNSRLGVVRFYRKGKLIGEHDLIRSLRGRPF